MIKVYGVPMSRAMRVLWTLEEVGAPYELVSTSFVTDAHAPSYLKINPNGRIPAIQDGEVTLFESLAINLYLARKYGQALWPKSIGDEGRAYQWSIWAMTELEEPVIASLIHRGFLSEAQRDPQKAEEAAARFVKPLAVLDGALASREWLAGPAFTIADLNVASVLMVAPMAGLDLAAAPNAAAWLGRCTARPALAKAQATPG
jgi:glutathione S-transferase